MLRPSAAERNSELRKNFTPSERVAIMETIERMKEGRPTKNSQNLASFPEAAALAGFGNRETARQAALIGLSPPALPSPYTLERGFPL